MKVTKAPGISEDKVAALVEAACWYKFAGNVRVRDYRQTSRNGASFTLRAVDSRKPGAHIGPNGRGVSVRWEVYRDVLRALFRVWPSAVVTTIAERYSGAQDFEEKHEATAYGDWERVKCRKF
jgi:hypothetical protein